MAVNHNVNSTLKNIVLNRGSMTDVETPGSIRPL
jgi:hypothetical protein